MTEIMPTILFMAIITLIVLVPAAAGIALVMWLLRRLVRKGRTLASVLVVIGVFVLLTGTSYLFNKTTSTSIDGVLNWPVEIHEAGVTNAEIRVAQSHKTKEIFGFGCLVVSDQAGNRYIPLTFDAQGTLIGSKDALPYEDAIRQAVIDLPGKALLTGSSLSWEQLEAVADDKLTTRNEIFSWRAVVVSMLQWNTVTLFLAIYLITQILRQRKKDRKDARRTEIRDL